MHRITFAAASEGGLFTSALAGEGGLCAPERRSIGGSVVLHGISSETLSRLQRIGLVTTDFFQSGAERASNPTAGNASSNPWLGTPLAYSVTKAMARSTASTQLHVLVNSHQTLNRRAI